MAQIQRFDKGVYKVIQTPPTEQRPPQTVEIKHGVLGGLSGCMFSYICQKSNRIVSLFGVCRIEKVN